MTTLLARGQITIAAIRDGKDGAQGKPGKDGKDYWQQDVWVDLSAATYDQNTWYTVVGEQLPLTGFAGIKVVVNLNSGTKPSWSTHSAGFSVDFHIDTQASGWGTTRAETIIYSDTFNFCPVSPVSYKQLGWGSRPVLYLRGGGKYRVISTYKASWKIYKDGYTWQSGQYSQSAKPSSSRPTPEGHTLKGDKGDKGEQGDRGPQGAAGKDAVTLFATPDVLTFDTDDSGKATGSQKFIVQFKVAGDSLVASGTSFVSATNFVDGYKPAVALSGIVTVDGSKIKSQEITDADNKTRYVSCTSASVTIKATYEGVEYRVTVPIQVNVASYLSRFEMTNKTLTSEFTEISNKYNALPLKTPDQLTQYTSTIKQSAREISLKVSQTAVGRKNLLVGSAFCKQSDKWKGNDSYLPYISVLNQYNGHNSVVLENGANTYHGLDFIRVPVKTGKYTAGVMAKFNGKPENGSFAIYVARKDADDKQIGNNSWIVVEVSNVVVGQWSLYSTSFDIEDKCKFIDLCFIYTNNPTAWFAQPMLVEGDEYVGWSLSEEDAEYIGGNLLDNTDTLVLGGNMTFANGHLYTDANSYKGFPTRQVNMLESTNAFLGVLEWDLSNDGVLAVGQDYMLSFMAKGNIGGKFVAYFYKDGNQVVYTEVLDRADGPNQHQAADGYAGVIFKEDYVWKRYWVHWRVVGDNLPKYVQIRCMKGCDLYVSQPKLEYGATVTEYRATKTDSVEDKSVAGKLLDAGIDIDSRRIILTADNTLFRSQSGKESAVVDGDGIKAASISTMTSGTKAGVEISGGLARFFGDTGVCNMRIGVDASGMAVLSYYDNDGNLLYDLGPSGIDTKGMTTAKLEEVKMCSVSDVLGSTYRADWTLLYDLPDGETYPVAGSQAIQKKLFNTEYTGVWKENNTETLAVINHRPTSGVVKTTLYRYTAARVQNAYVADSVRGLTAAMAAKANGKYFTSQTIASGGVLVNLANGEYLKPDTQPRSYAMGYEPGFPRFALEPFFAINDGVDERFVVYSVTSRGNNS